MPGCLVLAHQGTPWIDVKAMIIAAPLVLLLALVGGMTVLAETPARIAGLGLAAAIGIGVLVSNAFMYHSTALSPTARYLELERIGERFAGQGPTLRPDFDDYALYFTRRMDPDAPATPAPCATSASTHRRPWCPTACRCVSISSRRPMWSSSRPCSSSARRSRAGRPRTSSASTRAATTKSGSAARAP